MIVAKQEQSWIDKHEQLALSETDLVWLNEQREQAILSFADLGLPGIRDEDWRYTSLRALKAHEFELSKPTPLTVSIPHSELPRLVFVDGHFDANESTAQIDGFTPLAQAWHQDAVAEHFGTSLPKREHGFLELNSAYANDGYLISLSKGQVLDTLEIVFVWQQAQVVSHVRNLIVAAANSQCTIVERHIGSEDQVYLANCVTEVIAQDNAHVDHYKIQQGSEAGFHVGGVYICQQRGSQVSNHNIALNGKLNRNDIRGRLLGEGAHLEMNGLVLGQQSQHIDNHTEVVHAVPNCTSDEFYKTILDDESRSVFRGRIVVAEDAQQTNAEQQNNNLLLSANAEADSKPQLEIYADDVKCSHGATVGQLDPKSLFYLRSRGIDPESARALLTFAFANEVLERIRVESIREELSKGIAGELLDDI